MGGCTCPCCCCFGKPSHRKLVNNIFPDNPKDGLNKTNMDRLTFFAMEGDDNLEKVGKSLARRLSYDLARNNTAYVKIAMEALDTLLVTCHTQHRNIFFQSFFKMVLKLLKGKDIELQILASNSFIKFANIEGGSETYDWPLEFFIIRFSAMAQFPHASRKIQHQVRVAGLIGIQGVVRKALCKVLQPNIAKDTHMDMIIISLLSNMLDTRDIPDESDNAEDHPYTVAEMVFRDLANRASASNIVIVLKPTLKYFDDHAMWIPNIFPAKCFRIIIFSVQEQYAPIVIQMLVNHLDNRKNVTVKIKTAIINVLTETVAIAAPGSIWPSVFDVCNILLRHLCFSVNTEVISQEAMIDETQLQASIIVTIDQFATRLPDYQKTEVMLFIMEKVPLSTDTDVESDPREIQVQTILLKSILKMAIEYRTTFMINVFSTKFLESLLAMSHVHDPAARCLVQEIFQSLIDRHNNKAKLRTVCIPEHITQLNLFIEKVPRQDIMFMRKNGKQIYWHLYENLFQANNLVENFEAVYCTLSLIYVEMGGNEIMVELLRLALGIQQMGRTGDLTIQHKSLLQALVAAFINLVAHLVAIPALTKHVEHVISMRQKNFPLYLPEMAFNRFISPNSYPTPDDQNTALIFNTEKISEALKAQGYDTARLLTQYAPANTKRELFRSSKSASEILSLISTHHPSESITPAISAEDLTFTAMKKIFDINLKRDEEKGMERRRIIEQFRTGPFENIVARNQIKSQHLHSVLEKVLKNIAEPIATPIETPLDMKQALPSTTIPISAIKFPILFLNQ